jgi:xanthosine utilization system XapX-like protein
MGMSIQSVRKKYEERLLCLPNVTGIGIGEKAGKKVIKVFVTRKVPESALQLHEIIPKMLGAYETEVEEIGVVTVQDERRQKEEKKR